MAGIGGAGRKGMVGIGRDGRKVMAGIGGAGRNGMVGIGRAGRKGMWESVQPENGWWESIELAGIGRGGKKEIVEISITGGNLEAVCVKLMPIDGGLTE